jgi:methylenetetrahydrofolate reductase (NADPH)
MAQKNPLLSDVTWEAAGSTFDTTIDLCDNITNCLGNDIFMHLTCTSLTRERVVESLDRVKENEIKNILALREDITFGVERMPIENGFSCASELEAFIKEKFCKYFSVVIIVYF